MWTLAKADLALSTEELDTDYMALNVENGTLDLRTGSLREHAPGDLITKLAPVEFDVTAEAPRFYKFLKQVLADEELIRFVQRFLGYSLTGSTKERALSVLHSVGRTGRARWSSCSRTSWETTAAWLTRTRSCNRSTGTQQRSTSLPSSRAYGLSACRRRSAARSWRRPRLSRSRVTTRSAPARSTASRSPISRSSQFG